MPVIINITLRFIFEQQHNERAIDNFKFVLLIYINNTF